MSEPNLPVEPTVSEESTAPVEAAEATETPERPKIFTRAKVLGFLPVLLVGIALVGVILFLKWYERDYQTYDMTLDETLLTSIYLEDPSTGDIYIRSVDEDAAAALDDAFLFKILPRDSGFPLSAYEQVYILNLHTSDEAGATGYLSRIDPSLVTEENNRFLSYHRGKYTLPASQEGRLHFYPINGEYYAFESGGVYYSIPENMSNLLAELLTELN